MSYRAKVYYVENYDASNAIALVSETFATKEEADDVFGQLIRKPYFSGGSLEVNVPGIGWVVDGEEETALIVHRRNESERMTATDMMAEIAHREELEKLKERYR